MVYNCHDVCVFRIIYIYNTIYYPKRKTVVVDTWKSLRSEVDDLFIYSFCKNC